MDFSIPDFWPCSLALFPRAPKGVCLRLCVFESTDFLVCLVSSAFSVHSKMYAASPRGNVPTVLLFSLVGYEPRKPLEPFHFSTESQVHTLIEHLS